MDTWVGAARGRGMEAAGLGMLAAGVVSLVTQTRAVAPVLLLAGLVVRMAARVRVTIDDSGLTADASRWSWPRVQIPLDDIDAVTSMHVNPWRWGGWGYRGSLRVLRRAAWVVRAGPGLRLDLRDGRRFVVTVDDAPTAAAALGRRLTPRSG